MRTTIFCILAVFLGGGSMVMVGTFFIVADMPLILRVLSAAGSLIGGSISAFLARRATRRSPPTPLVT
jgi:hypothetical protein